MFLRRLAQTWRMGGRPNDTEADLVIRWEPFPDSAAGALAPAIP